MTYVNMNTETTMNELNTFSFESHPIRTIVDEQGEPWFVAKDVCDVLEISKDRDAVSRLDDDERGSVVVDTLGGPQQVNTISESGLYSLVLTSRKPESKRFKKWVTSEVLPSIRKTGTYGGFKVPQTISEALRLAADLEDQRKALAEKVQADAPKVLFHDAVAEAGNAQSMLEVAKLLGMGRNTLFAQLRFSGVLMKNNVPYQRYIDSGYFKLIEQHWTECGVTKTGTKTLVTGKGLIWLQKNFKNQTLISNLE